VLKSALIGVAASLSTAAAAMASPIAGTWHSPTKNGAVQVYDCGSQVCGRIVDGDDVRANPDIRDTKNKDEALRDRRVKGLVILQGFSGGPTEWSGGSVYDPTSGNTYHGTLTLVDSNTMHLKGCIFGPLCRTQTWTRGR
jgi:uncharacterized protein (DUF2147 family)